MHKNIFASKLLAVAVLLMPFYAAAEEDLPVPRNTQFTAGLERFKMENSAYRGGPTLEEESGVRGTVGIGWSNLFIPSEGSVYRANLTLYGGMSDFSRVGGSSTSTYAGLKFEGMGGYRIGSIVGVEVFSGMSADFWYRGVQDSTTVIAFDEYYAVASAKLGFSVLQRFSKFGYFIRAGIKAPFMTWAHANYLDGVDVTPVPQLSGFAEVNFTFGGIPRDRFVLSAYYDSYRFGKSKNADVTNNGVPAGVYYSYATNIDTVGVQAIFGF